jgi:hypothetical protein
MTYEIQSGIPLPRRENIQTVKLKKRFRSFSEMEIGDSILVNRQSNERFTTTQAKVRNYLTKQLSNQKFTIRTIEQGKSLRVWRAA